jgi:hypothetical protein
MNSRDNVSELRHIRVKSKSAERYRSRGGTIRNEGQPTYCGATISPQDTDRRTFVHVSKHSWAFRRFLSEVCPACIASLTSR